MERILYVLHNGTSGGTYLTNYDLMKNLDGVYEIFLLTAQKDSLNLYKYENRELSLIKSFIRKPWNIENIHDSWLTYIYFKILLDYHIDLIHIRHLIYHSFDLIYVAKKLEIKIILSFHDFYFICPFYVLLNEQMEYCKGICSKNNMNCYNPLENEITINSKKFINTWRKNIKEIITYVDYFVTTSFFVKDVFLSIYDNINSDNFLIIEHGRDFNNKTSQVEVPSINKAIKIVFPANHINKMKGSELIKKVKQLDKNNHLEFHFLGNVHEKLENYGITHGVYERDDFCKVINEIKPSFIGVFSIWPETFCHTITEAWSCGIPVLGTDIGVVKDRIESNKGGWIIDSHNPQKIYDKILSITENKNSYNDVIKNIKKISLKTTKDMACEYQRLYETCLNNNN